MTDGPISDAPPRISTLFLSKPGYNGSMAARGRLPMPHNVREIRGTRQAQEPRADRRMPWGSPAPGLDPRRGPARVESDRPRAGPHGIDQSPGPGHLGYLLRAMADLLRPSQDPGRRGHHRGRPAKREQVKNPAWQMFREISGVLLRVAKELGLTQSSRLRMPNPFDPEDDDDELERLLTQAIR